MADGKSQHVLLIICTTCWRCVTLQMSPIDAQQQDGGCEVVSVLIRVCVRLLQENSGVSDHRRDQ